MDVDEEGWEGKAGVNLRIGVIGWPFCILKAVPCLRTRRGFS
jgi:hypothetical protein